MGCERKSGIGRCAAKSHRLVVGRINGHGASRHEGGDARSSRADAENALNIADFALRRPSEHVADVVIDRVQVRASASTEPISITKPDPITR